MPGPIYHDIHFNDVVYIPGYERCVYLGWVLLALNGMLHPISYGVNNQVYCPGIAVIATRDDKSSLGILNMSGVDIEIEKLLNGNFQFPSIRVSYLTNMDQL